MKEITLTQGQVALVDDEDFERINKFKWHAFFEKSTNSFYAVRQIGPKIHRTTIWMHREVMNTPEGLDCDHIHHNTLDNRKSELRNVTRSQNLMNQLGARSNNRNTGILGVYKNHNGFQARISINGKTKQFPTRHTLEEAVADRKAAEEKYYGDYRGRK